MEAHVVDFAGDLYGQRVGVEFVDKIRDQRRFDGPAALIEQLRNDVESTRQLVTV